jgi:hypothetical protein
LPTSSFAIKEIGLGIATYQTGTVAWRDGEEISAEQRTAPVRKGLIFVFSSPMLGSEKAGGNFPMEEGYGTE